MSGLQTARQRKSGYYAAFLKNVTSKAQNLALNSAQKSMMKTNNLNGNE